MINIAFIEDCIKYVFCNKNLRSSVNEYTKKDIYALKEVQYILNTSTKNKDAIPIKTKILQDSLKYIINGKFESPSSLKSFMSSENMEIIKPYISKNLDDHDVVSLRKNINKMYKTLSLMNNSSELKSILEDINSDNIENIYESYSKYQEIISKIYIDNIVKGRSIETQDNDSSEAIVLNVSSLREKTKKLYGNNSDRYIFKMDSRLDKIAKAFKYGGFESKRIYMFAAKPGGGKSTLLMNFHQSFVKNFRNYCVDYKGKVVNDVIHVPFYITLENEVDESIGRYIYCAASDKNKNDVGSVINKINQSKDESKLLDSFIDMLEVKEINGDIESPNIIKYLPAGKTNINDIISFIEDTIGYLNDRYDGKFKFKVGPISVDYLDNMSSIEKKEQYRLTLSDIVLELKSLSILYKVPVLTATQLNDYTKTSKTISLGNLTESKKKAEHADFVAFIMEQEDDDNYINKKESIVNVNLSIKKNRNGSMTTTPLKYYKPSYYMKSLDECSDRYRNNINFNDKIQGNFSNQTEITNSGLNDNVF